MAAPKLRFKEFDGDWLKVDIQSLVDEKIIDKPMDGNHGEIHPTSADYVEDGIPFVMATDVIDGKVYLDKSKKIKKSQADGLRKGFSIEGDILLTHKATIGNVAKVPELETPYIMLTPQVTYYRILDQEKLLADFMKSNFESVTFQNELIALCTGATRLYIGISEQRKLPFSYPSKPEQTKIASFLSNVDEKISQLTQKHVLLSQYKQGMMQKLFSQQVRFKADDGSEFGEWEDKKLAEVCKFINGRAYKQTEWEKEGIPVIRLQNLTGSGKDYYYSNLNLPNHQYCYNNDLLYMWSATFGPVFWQGEKAIFHYHIWKIEVNPQLLDKKYAYFLLDEMTEKMKRSLNGSTMLHVTKQGMEDTVKTIPSLKEQTKIANFLSAIDQKIEVVAQQIEQAKTWKKGLLQQMFV